MALKLGQESFASPRASQLNLAYGLLHRSVNRLSSDAVSLYEAGQKPLKVLPPGESLDTSILNGGFGKPVGLSSSPATLQGQASDIDEHLVRMKRLACEAATDTYCLSERETMDEEYNKMFQEIHRIPKSSHGDNVYHLRKHTLPRSRGAKVIDFRKKAGDIVEMPGMNGFFRKYSPGSAVPIPYSDGETGSSQ